MQNDLYFRSEIQISHFQINHIMNRKLFSSTTFFSLAISFYSQTLNAAIYGHGGGGVVTITYEKEDSKITISGEATDLAALWSLMNTSSTDSKPCKDVPKGDSISSDKAVMPLNGEDTSNKPELKPELKSSSNIPQKAVLQPILQPINDIKAKDTTLVSVDSTSIKEPQLPEVKTVSFFSEDLKFVVKDVFMAILLLFLAKKWQKG